jgi:prevent-host-death family protein
VGLFQAKQRLSELVDEAERGQAVGITCRGVLKAVLSPVVEVCAEEAAGMIASPTAKPIAGSMKPRTTSRARPSFRSEG